MLCTIYYQKCNLKSMKNTEGGVLLLVKLQGEAFNFTRSNTPSWLFFTFSKLYNWYQIAQSITFSRLQLILLLIIHISSLIVTCNQKDFPISKSFSSLCYLWSGLVCDFPSSTLCQFYEAFVIFCNLTRSKIGICCLF